MPKGKHVAYYPVSSRRKAWLLGGSNAEVTAARTDDESGSLGAARNVRATKPSVGRLRSETKTFPVTVKAL